MDFGIRDFTRLVWIGCFFLYLISSCKGETETTLQKCCGVGSMWGSNYTTCAGPPTPQPDIPPADRSICLTAIYICCIRIHRHLLCEKGKQTARTGQTCSSLQQPGGEAHKDCCDACRLGLLSGSRGSPCTFSNFAFGSPWDQAYSECCQTAASNQGTPPFQGHLNSLCDRENPCSQRCDEVAGRIQCSCYHGFRLLPDQQNCEDVDECELRTHTCNSVTEKCVNTMGGFICAAQDGGTQNVIKPGQCPPGYIKNSVTQTCDDIDECAQGVCPGNEVCANTIGSYTCLPHNPQQTCPAGFRQHQVTDQCIDIDECAEKVDGCSKEDEICVNSHGSYHCIPKIKFGKDCPAGFKWNDQADNCEDVDECLENKHSCNLATQGCINSIGSYRCAAKLQTCPHGYTRVEDACEDVNECTEKLHDCDESQQDCVNMIGGYQCQTKVPPRPRCGTGYKYDEETGNCIDIDECTEDTHTCDRQLETCINSEGSFTCFHLLSTTTSPYTQTSYTTTQHTPINQPTRFRFQKRKPKQRLTSKPNVRACRTGFVYNPTAKTCVDVNECEELTPCLADQTCENTMGSYQCFCKQGYTLDVVSKACRDVNECQLKLHTCTPSQRCDNTVGSFTCVRTTSCGTGYTLNAQTQDCEDDDECTLGLHNCGIGFACRNTQGSFRCDRVRCPIGQKLLPDGNCQDVICNSGMEPDSIGNCVDINECALPNVCRKNQRCLNSIGSYRCHDLLNCGAGFEMNEYGTMCIDIDECAQRLDECGSQQICRNRPGGYTCECPVGYSLNAERQCEDIDECTRFQGQICSVTASCQNTQGSYICNCKEGFKKADDGKNCIDVDECLESPNICHQTCINVWGSYQCSCQQGYTLASDGRSCQDIDECTLWEGRGSLCIGVCENQPGSYSCNCPEGYRLAPDKRTCRDIDECQEQNVCQGENEVCLNTRGSFKCNIITCPPNYVRDRDHRNRCKRVFRDCQRGDSTCLSEPLSFSYNYITFVSKMRIPPSGQLDLFTMRGPRFTTTTVQFTLELRDARAPEGIPVATRDYFHLRRTAFNEAMVSLIKTITGPQELELELIMKMYHNGLFGGTAVAKIFIFVTEHEF